MKKFLVYILSAVFFLSLYESCTKALTEDVKGFVSPTNFYQNEQEDQAGVNSVYAVLYSFFSNWSFLVVTDASSDLMYGSATTTVDPDFAYNPGAPGFGAQVWTYGYQGILYANNTIFGVQNSPVADSVKVPLMAEARFLRSLYYFFLTNTFNDVPFWTMPLNTEDRVQQVAQLPREKASLIRDSLIADLKACAADLPLKQTGTNTGRATRGAALALEQKIALFNKDWKTAIEAGSQIVADGQYTLVPDYADIFSEKNTAESIFEIQYSYSTAGVQRSQSLPAYMMPGAHTANSSIYDGVDLGTKVATTYGNTLPTRILAGLYTDSNDTRKNTVLGYSYNGNTFNRYKTKGLPWMGPKFWDLSMLNLASSKNLLYLRYADVLLMLAEAYNESNDQASALHYLNLVRERAHIADYTNQDQDSVRQTIRDERARELAGEYQRRWDLVRWGIFYDAVRKTAADNPIGVENLKPNLQYYPIPAMEITKNQNLVQNPGY